MYVINLTRVSRTALYITATPIHVCKMPRGRREEKVEVCSFDVYIIAIEHQVEVKCFAPMHNTSYHISYYHIITCHASEYCHQSIFQL